MMKIDPRNPPSESVIPTDSQHEFHKSLRKTLVLLKLDLVDGPLYFVIEGLGTWPLDGGTLAEREEYFYEESQCPTNFIKGVELMSFKGDHDPHGLFEVVDAVWMTTEYAEAENPKEYILEVFPQLSCSLTIDGGLAPLAIGAARSDDIS